MTSDYTPNKALLITNRIKLQIKTQWFKQISRLLQHNKNGRTLFPVSQTLLSMLWSQTKDMSFPFFALPLRPAGGGSQGYNHFRRLSVILIFASAPAYPESVLLILKELFVDR